MHQNVVGSMNSVCTYNFVKFVIYILALPEKFNYIKSQGIVPVLPLTDIFIGNFTLIMIHHWDLKFIFLHREY